MEGIAGACLLSHSENRLYPTCNHQAGYGMNLKAAGNCFMGKYTADGFPSR